MCSSPLTSSSSVLSFISPPLPCEATWLTSISLSVESVSWASVCTLHAQTKCFSILFYFSSPFILPQIWELLSRTLLSHEQVASCGPHVSHDCTECLVHWKKYIKKLLFSKISTKNPSQLFKLRPGQLLLVKAALCPCWPMISDMQLTSAPL